MDSCIHCLNKVREDQFVLFGYIGEHFQLIQHKCGMSADSISSE